MVKNLNNPIILEITTSVLMFLTNFVYLFMRITFMYRRYIVFTFYLLFYQILFIFFNVFTVIKKLLIFYEKNLNNIP